MVARRARRSRQAIEQVGEARAGGDADREAALVERLPDEVFAKMGKRAEALERTAFERDRYV